MSSLRVSPKYGVNPSLDMCFFCGESKQLILFGLLKYDEEAPRQVMTSYEPCDKCQTLFSQGILFVAVQESPVREGQTPIQEGAYPTGSYGVLKEEAVKRLITDPQLSASTLQHRSCLISQEDYNLIFNHDDSERDT